VASRGQKWHIFHVFASDIGAPPQAVASAARLVVEAALTV